MKSIYKKLFVAVGFFSFFVTAVEATPAFARQVNADCKICHYQNIPKLNSFGREFKLSGFTMTGGIAEISSNKGMDVALPSILNFGFITKARLYRTADLEMKTEIFDESAFVFGGKIADGVGTSMEFDGDMIGGKILFTKQTDIGRVGLTYFNTAGLGAFSATEVYSTGLYRPIRQFENRNKANIFQKLGIGDGAATGFMAYYNGNGLTASIGQYAPIYGTSAITDSIMKNIARTSYSVNSGNINVSVGAYYIGGDVSELVAMNSDENGQLSDKINGVDLSALDRESTGIDFQLESDIEDISMMITGGVVLSNKYSTDSNISKAADNSGFSIAAQLNPTAEIGVKVALLNYSDKIDSNNNLKAVTLGSDLMFAQNIRFAIEVTETALATQNSNGDKYELDILLMSMIAF